MRPSVFVPKKVRSSAYGQEEGVRKIRGEGSLHVPAGTAMLMSVSTRALPRAGTTVALEA